MEVSVYSVIISVVFFNIALVAAFIMRRSSVLLAKQTVSFLLLTVILGVVRLLVPIDFDRAFVIRSYQVIPAIRDFLNRPVVGSLSLAFLLLIVWAVGTVGFLSRDLLVHLRFLRTVRRYPAADRRDLLELAGEFGSNYGLLVSPMISRPYVAGLFRPIIYLPDLELPEEQWRIVLRHEVQHIRSHDAWKKLFFLAIQALFWWNPLAHISLSEIDTLLELQCDARVTAGMGAEEVDRYLETLKALKTQSLSHKVPAGASALVWDEPQLVSRFQALQNAGVARKKRHVAAYLTLALLFVLSYFVIVQPYYTPDEAYFWDNVDEADEMNILPFNSETINEYILHENGEYHYYFNAQYIGPVDEDSLSDEAFQTIPIIEVNK